MGGARAFRLILAVLIAIPVLRPGPAFPWHGSGGITALAIDPRTPTTLYAGTSDRGVFKSTDGGANWSTTGPTNITVTALTIDPLTPTTLYVGTSIGAFKSTDGGGTWNPISLTPSAIDPLTPTTLYARTDTGVFKSTDGGTNWSATGLTNASVQALAIDPRTPTTLYAVIPDAGVLKSTDGGATWSPTGLWTDQPQAFYPTTSLQALAIDPLTPTTLYAGVGYISSDQVWGEVFKSTDGGATWSSTWLDLVWIQALFIDPRKPTTLYAVIRYPGYAYVSEDGDVFKSTDGGATWLAVSTGLTNILQAYGVAPSVGPLAIDPVTPTTLYAGTSIGVFKSTDGAAFWSPTGLFEHSPLVSFTLNPTSVFGGTPVTGTVTLITAAPAGGVTVSLSSSNPTVVTVPSSVTVSAGATSASFPVSTNPVTAPWWVVIYAAFDDATRSAYLYVTRPIPFTVSLNPTRVIGGTDSTGTVTLSAAAPAGGAVVELSSNNVDVATVPATVTVSAGTTSANFAIITQPVTASTWVWIRGTYDGFTDGPWLLVDPAPAAPALSSLSLTPTSVTAGSASTGTVTLSMAAPAGGAAVALSSSNPPVASTPASVTVPAGATSVNFTVFTVACTSGSVTISGIYGGVTRSAGLTVTLPVADTLTIQQADYFTARRELRIAAKSTSSTAMLWIYVTSTREFVGELGKLGDGKYSGQFTWPANPQNITILSSLCGSVTSNVRSK